MFTTAPRAQLMRMAVGFIMITVFQTSGHHKAGTLLSVLRKGAIDIPVMFSYTFNKYGNVKPFICAGPVIQIGLSNKIVDAQTSTSLDLYREDNYSLAPGGAFRRFNVLAGPGAGVVIFDRIRINVGYNFGLVRRTKNQAADEPYRNNQFYAGVSLLF